MPAKKLVRLRPQKKFDDLAIKEDRVRQKDAEIYARTAEFMQALGSLDPVKLLDGFGSGDGE